MDLDPVFLSRLQFAFVIGYAAWLATTGARAWATGNPVYQQRLGRAPVGAVDCVHSDLRH